MLRTTFSGLFKRACFSSIITMPKAIRSKLKGMAPHTEDMVQLLQRRYDILQDPKRHWQQETLAKTAKRLGITLGRLKRAWHQAYTKSPPSFKPDALRDANWKRGRPHRLFFTAHDIRYYTSFETLRGQAGMSIAERCMAITRAGRPIKPYQLRLLYKSQNIRDLKTRKRVGCPRNISPAVQEAALLKLKIEI